MPEPLTQEPTRLLADPDLDPRLRRDLELARSHPPIDYRLDAGLARFEQAVHGASTVPPGGSVAGLRVLGWFVGALALVGGVGYLLIAEPGHTTAAAQAPIAVAPAPAPASTARAPAVVTPPSPAQLESPAQLVVEPREPDRALEQAGVEPEPEPTGARRPKPATAPSAPSLAPSLADEAAQINAARKALERDPAKALALVEAAEQQFPDGAMIQERRGYAILALVGLGRLAEAESQADAYLERWPNGPLSRRVRDALGR